MSRIGVLALQGGFGAHARALAELGHQAIAVRSGADLAGLDGLILPGGESTAQLRLIDRHRLGPPLEEFAASGRPILATCAGLILAARRVRAPEQRSFGWIDATVSRNGWGRQVDSFEAETDEVSLSAPNCNSGLAGSSSGAPSARVSDAPAMESAPLPLIFIRAPRILQTGANVQVLATLDGEPILIREGNLLGATFHPELTPDRRVHHSAFGLGLDPPVRSEVLSSANYFRT
jgi:5'-phosphate synthase pdxT subunit